ncbi:MAG TPA: beta-ketoacyl synthase N-terminal-like domain-containing protein, partial [Fimbriimonadaceae bacterium]|nr:beta-ketoacyl synthase N-terminal-like domain-containing protein [Fimbriimonadaceae bacterium]
MTPQKAPSGRVVVTGIGAVTPLGIGVDKFWDCVLSGASGVAPITLFDVSEYTTRIAAEVKGFEPEQFVEKKDARRLDRFILFAIAGAKMAIEDAGFPEDPDVRESTGVLIGSGIGG